MTEIMLSALQHYAFCPRQCALIHVEQVWQENSHTAQGRLLHETAHETGGRMRGGVKAVTNLELCSKRWGLHGRADIVEFSWRDGVWIPYPVEYKKAGRTGIVTPMRCNCAARRSALKKCCAYRFRRGRCFMGVRADGIG